MGLGLGLAGPVWVLGEKSGVEALCFPFSVMCVLLLYWDCQVQGAWSKVPGVKGS